MKVRDVIKLIQAEGWVQILLHKPEAPAKDLRWRFRLVCGRFLQGDIEEVTGSSSIQPNRVKLHWRARCPMTYVRRL